MDKTNRDSAANSSMQTLAVIHFHVDGMRNAAGTAEGVKLTPKACGNIADELGRVEAAVAELIAAANDFRTTQSAVWIEDRWADLTSRYCPDTHFPTHGEVVIAVRNRFDAALARVGGGE